MAYRKDWTQPAQGDQGFARTMKCFGRKINIVPGDMTLNAVVGAFTVPANFMVLGIFGKTDALGTSLAVSIGTPATPALLLAGQSLAAAANISTTLAAGGQFTKTTSQTEIQILVTTAATAAQVAGVLELYVWGCVF